MNDAHYEAELLDQFMDALRQNPHALPPAGLDPELVVFARTLVSAEQVSPPRNAQARVWEKIVQDAATSAQHSPNGHGSHVFKSNLIERENPMTHTANPYRQIYRNRYALAAAVLLVVLAAFWVGQYFAERPTNLEAIMPPRSPGTQAAQSDVITIGDVIEATLTEAEPGKRYHFEAQAGQVISVQISASAEVMLSYRAESPGGTEESSPLPGRETVLTVSVPVNSTITVMVDAPLDADFPVYFTLFLNDQSNIAPPEPLITNFPGEPIQIGDTITGTLDAENPRRAYTFQAKIGQVVDVQMIAEGQPLLMGTRVVSLPEIGTQGGGGGGGGGSATREITTTLNFTYNAQTSIEVSAPPDTQFPAAFTVSIIPKEVPVLRYGEQTSGTFDGSTIDRFFEFEGQRGEIVTLRVEGNPQNDLLMRLIEPGSSTTAIEDDDSGTGYLPEIADYQLSQTGRYLVIIEVQPFSATGINTPDFDILLERQILPLEVDELLSIHLTGKQNSRLAIYEGRAGEKININVSRFADPDLVSLTVLQNGEELLLMPLNPGDGQVVELTIPDDGEVLFSLNVNATPGWLGVIEVTLIVERIEG